MNEKRKLVAVRHVLVELAQQSGKAELLEALTLALHVETRLAEHLGARVNLWVEQSCLHSTQPDQT